MFKLIRVLRDRDDAGGSGATVDDQTSFMGELLGGTGDDQSGNDATLEKSQETVEQTVEDGAAPESLETEDRTLEATSDEEEIETPSMEETNQLLRNQIIALTEMINADPLQQTVQTNITAKPEGGQTQDQSSQQTVTTPQVADYLTAEELDRLVDEPQLVNVAIQRAQMNMLNSIGNIISTEVNRQIAVAKAVSDFYASNQDLLPYSKFVQFVMAEVEKTNRDKTYGEIFETTASECRKRLGLPTAVTKQRQANNGNPASNKQKPAFAGSRRSTGRPGNPGWFDESASDMF